MRAVRARRCPRRPSLARLLQRLAPARQAIEHGLPALVAYPIQSNMRYADGIKRENESIERWCRRYFGISGCDEQRSHVRFHQRLGQRANPSCSASPSCTSRSMSTNARDGRRREPTSAVRVAGNIRELQNVIERAVIFSNASVSPAGRHQGMMDARP